MRGFKKVLLAFLLLFGFSSAFCEEKFNLKSYVNEIENKIETNWKPDFEMPKAPVEVKIIILKDGTLKSAVIKQSSGSKKTDDSAIKAVNISQPFEPLPKEYDFPELEVDFILQTKVINTVNQKALGIAPEEWVYVSENLYLDKNSIKNDGLYKTAWFSEYFADKTVNKFEKNVHYEVKKAFVNCENKSLKFENFKYYDEFDKYIGSEDIENEFIPYSSYPKGEYYLKELCKIEF